MWGDLYPGDSVGWRQECYIGYAELVTQHSHYTHYFSSLHTPLTSTHHTNSEPGIIIFSNSIERDKLSNQGIPLRQLRLLQLLVQ